MEPHLLNRPLLGRHAWEGKDFCTESLFFDSSEVVSGCFWLNLEESDLDHPKSVDLEMEGLFSLLDLIKNFRNLILAIFLVGTLASLVVAWVSPRVWQAEASLVPSSKLTDKPIGAGFWILASAANGMGVNLGTNGESLTALFPHILKSRPFLLKILNQSFLDSSNQQETLLARLVPTGRDTLISKNEAIRKFKKKLLSRLDSRSGVTTISVRLNDPILAAAVANAVVKELDQFSRQAKASLASQNSIFISQRLLEIRGHLEENEKALKLFRLENPQLSDSPQLRLEENALVRDVQIQTELLISLNTQMEMARIEEERNLPLISVLNPAYAPDRPFSPVMGRVAGGSAVGFLALGLILSFFINYFRVKKSVREKDQNPSLEGA